MNWKKFWYGQLVTADGASSGINLVTADNKEAIENVIKDCDLDGVQQGLVVSENSPTPDMTVDITAGTAYDHDGERTPVSPAQNEDLSGITLPGSGKEKWVRIFLAFSQTTSVAWTDDDGTPGYWKQDEGFSIDLVEGAEATPPATRPSTHPSKVVLADVLLYNGMTSIVDADIYTDEREVAFFPASKVGVDSSGWSVLESDSLDLQTALDDVDTKIIDVDGSGEITQNLIPDGDGTRDLGSASKAWDAYIKEVKSDLIPLADQQDLGSTTKRWDAFIYDLWMYGEVRTDLIPNGDGTHDLGGSSSRYGEAHASVVYGGTSGTRTGALQLAGSSSYERHVAIESAVPHSVYNGAQATWSYIRQYNLDGTIDQWVNRQDDPTDTSANYLFVPLLIPDGASLSEVAAYVYQSATATDEMQMAIWKQAYTSGSRTQIGSTTTVGTFGSRHEIAVTGLSETIDNLANRYYIEFKGARQTGAIRDSAVESARTTFSYQDVGRAPGW